MVTEIQKEERGSKTHDFRLLPSLKIQEWNRVMVTIFSYLCGCFFNATCESGLKILMLDGSQTQVWLLFFYTRLPTFFLLSSRISGSFFSSTSVRRSLMDMTTSAMWPTALVCNEREENFSRKRS